MRLLLVNPKSKLPIDTRTSPPLGLAYLAAVAEQRGDEVCVHDVYLSTDSGQRYGEPECVPADPCEDGFCGDDYTCHPYDPPCLDPGGHCEPRALCAKPIPFPPLGCEEIRCDLGTICELRDVECFSEPCNPVPTCVAVE